MRIPFLPHLMILAFACNCGSGNSLRDVPADVAGSEIPAEDTIATGDSGLPEDGTAADGVGPDAPDVPTAFLRATEVPPTDPATRPALRLAIVDPDETSRTFVVEVAIEGPADVSGIAFNLAYDPALLEPAGAEAFEVLSPSGSPRGVALGAFVDARPAFAYGDVLFRDGDLNGQTAYYYKGPLTLPTRTLADRTVLARAKFHVRAAGTCDIAFAAGAAAVRDASNAPVPTALWALTLEVTP